MTIDHPDPWAFYSEKVPIRVCGHCGAESIPPSTICQCRLNEFMRGRQPPEPVFCKGVRTILRCRWELAS